MSLSLPLLRLDLLVDLPDPIDVAALDRWLERAFELQPGGARPAADWVAEVGRRCLSLAAELLRAAGAPLFQDGVVLASRPEGAAKPGRRRLSAAVPVVDGIAPACVEAATRGGVVLVRWMAGHACTPESIATLHALAGRQVDALRRQLPSGKSTIPLLREAWRLGIPFVHLGAAVYQLGWGARGVRVARSASGVDSAVGASLAQDKHAAAGLLRRAGMPAPEHFAVRTLEEAAAAADRLGWPVVVKPVALDRGEGVSVDVDSPAALAAAFERALLRAPRRPVLVERQVGGTCHRIFVAGGRMLYAVRRLPKCVTGDGETRIAELVAQANSREQARPPWRRSEPFPFDDEARAAMAAAGFDPEAVPPAGALVPLRRIESTADGGFDIDETARVHPDNVDLALRAARLFGLAVAGVDLITDDIGRPWHAGGAVLNEVNFAPLLGGGEISRGHIPEYLRRLVDGDGRIPVEVVVGEDPGLAFARGRQRVMAQAGLRCHVTGHDTTLDASGAVRQLSFEGLGRRCRALLLDSEVDALVLVASTDELLRGPLPVDRVAGIFRANPEPQADAADSRLGPAEIERLVARLVRIATPTKGGSPGPGRGGSVAGHRGE
ncbi:acetate--CoA ligase family protein [Quisquiliibacterium transsilvanicum]|uniref:Cyanophycin synthetase n=1 Tax=Quisquiliibacterium transsilvanicum TaxID=1549638 RepID=A0A7W8HK40_9BURK|nr:acetate--CoA ligase family protein [Quisquiliibacterium transsilvanicum]MBB5273500.1 cyanophycin synthetase [Quisquiliibacterium transsilvanicum]